MIATGGVPEFLLLFLFVCAAIGGFLLGGALLLHQVTAKWWPSALFLAVCVLGGVTWDHWYYGDTARQNRERAPGVREAMLEVVPKQVSQEEDMRTDVREGRCRGSGEKYAMMTASWSGSVMVRASDLSVWLWTATEEPGPDGFETRRTTAHRNSRNSRAGYTLEAVRDSAGLTTLTITDGCADPANRA